MSMRCAPTEHADLATGTARSPRAPLIAHVIYRLDVGGLENGLLNLINRIPAQRFRHAIVSMTDCSAFRNRLTRTDVPIFSLHKPPGNSLLTQFKLWRLLRRLRPDIVHTRNIGALEATLPAALAGVPVRIHGEHGRDVDDLDGTNAKRRIVRRLYRPFVHQYIALSRDLASYLEHKVGAPTSRIAQIYNGVDSGVFHPADGHRETVPCAGFCAAGDFVIGSVGRMQDVKDPLVLARAFVRLVQMMPQPARRPRLVMIGDGPLRERVLKLLSDAGASEYAWLPGERSDVSAMMRCFDLFVLPSLAEGISNTILEAMASGLPVLATAVGGNPELVQSGVTGTLVPRSDAECMAQAMRAYAEDSGLCRRHGAEARRAIECRFGMESMVSAYMAVYDKAIAATAYRVRA